MDCGSDQSGASLVASNRIYWAGHLRETSPEHLAGSVYLRAQSKIPSHLTARTALLDNLHLSSKHTEPGAADDPHQQARLQSSNRNPCLRPGTEGPGPKH